MVVIDEDIGIMELCTRIFSGILMRDILVNVMYEDKTALGKQEQNPINSQQRSFKRDCFSSIFDV